uniref:SSD domain-containing protein n=1 Tax=Ditylenchus dipsaci TaxID=166011 RepID=A0A915EU51_9BILA
MPFLVVAVGVDNMFLMVAAIRRTNRAYSVSRRMGEAMSDAAISMVITALTDAFCFGVGAITTIPAVQIFCSYTCAAIFVTFIYQLTFFAGLLASGRRNERSWIVESSLLDGSRADPDASNHKRNLKESSATHFFKNWYAPVLMQRLFVLLLLFGFVSTSDLPSMVDSYAIPHYRAWRRISGSTEQQFR